MKWQRQMRFLWGESTAKWEVLVQQPSTSLAEEKLATVWLVCSHKLGAGMSGVCVPGSLFTSYLCRISEILPSENLRIRIHVHKPGGTIHVLVQVGSWAPGCLLHCCRETTIPRVVWCGSILSSFEVAGALYKTVAFHGQQWSVGSFTGHGLAFHAMARPRLMRDVLCPFFLLSLAAPQRVYFSGWSQLTAKSPQNSVFLNYLIQF